MKRPARWLERLLRWQPFLLPALVLIATWLPGCNHGWPRTDTHRYAALALDCYWDAPFWAPTLGDMAYFNKPPLVFWIEGALLSVTGPQIWAIRLPTLLAAIGVVWLVVDLMRRLSGPRAATLTGLVLATTLEFFRYTRAISLDMWVALFSVGLVWCAVRAVHARGDRGAWRWVLLGALPIGAALMTKPFVVFVPVGLVGVWLVTVGRWRLLVPLAGAAAIGAALATPWHVAMVRTFGDAFVDTYFFTQTLDRIEGEGEVGNPWWYPLGVLGRLYLPWVVTLVLGVEAVIRGRFRAEDRAAVRLALVWTIGWMVALTVFGDRRTRYMVPLYPLMAVLSGLWLARVLPASMRRSGRGVMVWVGPVAVVVGAAVNLLPPGVLDKVHEGRAPKWDAVLEYQRAHEVRELWVTPLANTFGANLYLMTGAYPRLVGPTPEGYGAPAPAGALVLGLKSEEAALEGMGEIVLRAGDVRLVRVGRGRERSALPDGGADDEQ